MAAGPADKLTAYVVQNYQISEEIGRDACSRLFHATSPSLASAVIIQVIPGDVARDPEFHDRLASRLRKAASLAHRNILRVHHFAYEEPNYYIILDYFDGRPLARRMEGHERLSVAQVLNFLNQALEALDHAHKNGLAHGALHPGGILLAEDGEVRLTGFGIAKAIDPQTMLVERADQPYLYKSPEQRMALPVDARSDLYSLGLIAWQALTGRFPAGDEPQGAGAFNPEVSAELDEVLMRMLATRPRERFRTARQAAIALSAAQRSRAARRPAPPPATVAPPAAAAATEQTPAPIPSPSPAATSSPGAEGIAAYKKGNIEDAVRLLEQAAAGAPHSAKVLGYLGAAYYAARRYADAAESFRRALALAPGLALLRYDLGNALLAQGRIAEARAEFERAWEQDPKCTGALLMLVALEQGST